MKKLFFLLCPFIGIFLFLSSVFALNDPIEASISEQNMMLGDSFQLNVEINSSALEGDDIRIEIPGIESFQLFSQSQGYRYSNINGETQSILAYTLDFTAYQGGTFSLGPVKIILGNTEIEDNEIFSIEVAESPLAQIQKEDLNASPPQEIQEDENIRDIRSWKPSIFGIIGFLGIFFVLFYSFLEYILFPKIREKKKKKQEKTVSEPQDFRKEMKTYFEKLELKMESISSEKFFRKYNQGIRKIFTHEGIQDAMSATLKEIQSQGNISERELFHIFKKSYEYEYSGKKKTVATRKKYITLIINLLQK